jgi:hypothetical protein
MENFQRSVIISEKIYFYKINIKNIKNMYIKFKNGSINITANKHISETKILDLVKKYILKFNNCLNNKEITD